MTTAGMQHAVGVRHAQTNVERTTHMRCVFCACSLRGTKSPDKGTDFAHKARTVLVTHIRVLICECLRTCSMAPTLRSAAPTAQLRWCVRAHTCGTVYRLL
jgi:hypothetical protein